MHTSSALRSTLRNSHSMLPHRQRLVSVAVPGHTQQLVKQLENHGFVASGAQAIVTVSNDNVVHHIQPINTNINQLRLDMKTLENKVDVLGYKVDHGMKTLENKVDVLGSKVDQVGVKVDSTQKEGQAQLTRYAVVGGLLALIDFIGLDKALAWFEKVQTFAGAVTALVPK